MPVDARLRSFWRNLLRRQALERELDEELAAYVDELTRRNLDAGLDPKTARREALIQTGGLEQVRERVRAERIGTFLESLVRDLGYALKRLARSPGFTTVAVASLALGIGGTTAVFTVIDALALRPLPAIDPESLVSIEAERMDLDAFSVGWVGESPLTFGEFNGIRDRSDVVSDAFIYTATSSAYFRPDDGPEIRLDVGRISTSFLSTLGIQVELGRGFMEMDDERSDSSTMPPSRQLFGILSHRVWQSAFGGDDDVIGRTVTLYPPGNFMPQQVTIVGVAPAAFTGVEAGISTDLWTTFVPGTPQTGIGPYLSNWWYQSGHAIARLERGVSLGEAEVELNALYRRLLTEWRAEHGAQWSPAQTEAFLGQRLELRPAAAGGTTAWQALDVSLLTLTVGVVCLLLIGCANVAALLIARGEARLKELALRLAMGCGRLRLTRQLLTESATLAVIGGLAGWVVAYLALRVLVASTPSGATSFETVALDWRALAFATAISIASVVVFGLAPALIATRLGLDPAIRQAGTGVVRARAEPAFGKRLIVAQIALSMMLLVGAGLFVETLENLRGADAGFDREHVVHFTVDRIDDHNALLERLEQVPGIDAATAWNNGVLTGGSIQPNEIEIVVDGYSGAPGPTPHRSANVGPGFLETMGIELLAGRSFRQDEFERSDRVLVSRAFAEHFFGDRNPAGLHFQFATDPPTRKDIIGVVENVKYQNLREEPQMAVYYPLQRAVTPIGVRAPGGGEQLAFIPYELKVAVRTPLDLGGAARAIRTALADVAPGSVSRNIQTMDTTAEATIARERLTARLATAFGLAALFLTAVGLYGSLAYSVVRRTHEIGVRMALGARVRHIMGRLMNEAGRIVGLGLLLGLGASLIATRAVSNLLFGITPTDPATIASAALFLVAACAAATYLPARRAGRLDPLAALRHA